MSEARVNLIADASQLYQELEKAAETLNRVRGAGDLSGRTISQSYDLASKSTLALNNYLKQNAIQMRNTKAEAAGIKAKLTTLNREHKIAGLNIRDLNKSYDNLVASYKKNAAAMNANEREALNLIQQWKRSRTTINLLTDKQLQYRNALNATTIAQNNLRQSSNQLRSSQAQMGGGFRSLLKIGNQLAGVFGAGLGVYGIVRAFRGAVLTIRDFDQEIRTLASISGATAQEIEDLSRVAIKVGMSTKFSATEVAGLMTELSKLGFAVDEINKMTDGISKLATATNEELSPTAETVGNIIRAMGYDASQTAQIVDVMALSFTRSALDLSRFRESMKYISPLAKSVGFSVENVSAVLAKLADAGVSGSMAGTSLRNVFMSLSDSSSDLSKALGGSITNFDDFITSMENLKNSGIEAGEVFKLIDRRAVTALNTILENTSSIRQLSKDMEEANGAVDEMANIQMQSLKNRTDIAVNAWQGFILALDKGDGALSRMARSTLTWFARTMENITSGMNLQSKEMENQLSIIRELERVMYDSNTTMNERIKIIRRLNEEYPEMFEGIEIEEPNWKNIEKALDDAIEKKKAYIGIQFNNENAQKHRTEIERLQEDYRNMGKDVILLFESLDQSSQEFQTLAMRAYSASEGVREFQVENERLNETIGNTSVTLEEFYKALVNRRALNQAEKDLKRLADTQRSLLVAQIPAEEGLLDESFLEIVKDVSNGYIDEMNKMAAASMQGGDSRVQAYNNSLDQIKDIINEEISSLEQRREAIKEEMRLPMVPMYEEIGLTEESINYQIELRKIALKEVLESMEETLKLSSDEIEERGTLLRLDQKIAEERARLATGGIELQERLAEIRKKYAIQIAKETLEKAELDKTIQLINLQYQNDLKNIEIDRIKEVSKRNEEAHERKIQQLESEENIISAQGGASENPRIAAIENELSILDQSYRKQEQIREKERKKEEDELKSLLEQKRALYKEDYERLEQAEQDHNLDMIALNEIYQNEKIKNEREYLNEVIELNQKLFEAKQQIYKEETDLIRRQRELKRTSEEQDFGSPGNLIEALDILGIRTRRQREMERQHAKERLMEELEYIEAQKESLKLRIASLKESQKESEGEEANLLAQQIEQAQNALENINLDEADISLSLKQLLSPNIDEDAWGNVISNLKGVMDNVVNIYQGVLDEQYRIAQEERALRDRNISELQRDLDIQLRLNEQGFASNVQAYMQALEQEKRLREQALTEERQAAEEKRRIEQITQTVSLLSSVANILKQETSKFGLVGIATAALGIAGLWALWGGAQSKAQTSTQFKKGGSFILEGASHANGGIPLTPGREAEGGEMVSVFSRPATRKYGSQIKDMTDYFNSGKSSKTSGEYFFDTSDIKAIRKLLENKEDVQIQGNYKLIKSGTKTTICRLN